MTPARFFFKIPLDALISLDIMIWCKNMYGDPAERWALDPLDICITFADEEDAVGFKLRWSDYIK